jgi:hypothetical protein
VALAPAALLAALTTFAPAWAVLEPSQEAPDPTVSAEAATGVEEPILGAEEAAPVEKLATIAFTSDAPCSLLVGGISMGSLEPGTPLEVPVESLTVQVLATATAVPLATWSEDLVLEPDEVRAIAIPMLETIEDQRKKERREQTFRDLDRGWMWGRRDNGRDIAWAGASAYCESLDLGGFDNWRLPALDELQSLEAMWSLKVNKIADQIFLSSCCLWSSTEGSERGAWNLDFRFRRAFEVNRTLSFGLRSLCMREMTADELAESRLAADPKERKRRLKERRQRLDERKKRKAEKARAKKQPEAQKPPS